MKSVIASGMLVLALYASCAFAGDTLPRGAQERLVKDISLQGFFHLAHPWQLKIYQPSEQDADIGNHPVRVCFVGPVGARTSTPLTQCTALFEGSDLSTEPGLPLQTLTSADLEMLPGAPGQPARPSLVIQAAFSGGGPGAIKGLYIWTGHTNGASDNFQETFHSAVGEAGDHALLKTGPLAGAFVAVEQVYEGNEPNMESPVRYEMTIYEPAPIGYVKVLSFLSEQRYPSNHTRDGLPDAISSLTPIIVRTLKAVYPQGVATLQQ